ncbi:hypothetical protein TTHERM_00695630 (macronuclear) [Tetrahymena thermophila SB210]|uniref:Uncharacterized protein n=1 Tax=Tetrahymena thermophila (strain SB210) TaxID=312017 RepID=Q24CA9_TETTS|nr:hypothetical protein TTHERM_00695630 [Tetrahymena thermophila SB210]EAS05329.2 hypothetical protein TTHERM_00695630 [Tetrahymena thermophila SB210]|eukprot:XP_001025574.2 hypothetical protein TTHERM_00695630 [Tetrahymena thermophila SB210]
MQINKLNYHIKQAKMDISDNQIQKTDNEVSSQNSFLNQQEYYLDNLDSSKQKDVLVQQSTIQNFGIKSRESNNQILNKYTNVSRPLSYVVKLSNYSYLEKVIEKIKDQVKFKQSMKRINFLADFTEKEVEEILAQYGEEENYPVILERNNKDQAKTIDFRGEKQYCMQHFENKYLKEKKANEEIEYELKEYSIDIKNKKMDQSRFQSLCQEIITERDSIVSIEISMIEIFNEGSNFYSSKDAQIQFFNSPFIQFIIKQYNLIAQKMQYDKNSSKLSVSFSESDSECESSLYRNFEKYSKESKLILFGLNQQKLESCFEHLKNYESQPLYLDFSDLTNINSNINKQSMYNDTKYNSEFIKTKIEIFKRCFEKQFEDMLKESKDSKGLRGEKENQNDTQIRYRLDGDQRDIQNIQKWCEEKISSIQGNIFSTQYNDQFLEKEAKKRINNIVEKIKEINTMTINNKFDEVTIFMYIRNPESENDVNNVIEQLEYISNLKRDKLQPEISVELLNKIDDFNSSIESEKNKFCFPIQKFGKNIYLTGTLQQIEKTKQACQDYIKMNIQKTFHIQQDFCINQLNKSIFIKYFQTEFQNEFPDFEVVNQNSLQYSTIYYKIKEFQKKEVEEKLTTCLKEINSKIQESVVSCTQNQFQILQKEISFLHQVQQKYSVEIITDPKRLNELGHTVKDLDVNSFHIKQQLAFSTTNSKLQVCLLCADIQNVNIDSLMINMKISGNYIDNFSPEIVNQTQCGKFVIQEINQINAGTSKLLLDYPDNEDDDDGEDLQNSNPKKRKNQKRKFQYFSVSHLNTNFPIKHICISVLKENKSNIRNLLKKFLKENEQNFKIGIIIPKEEDLDILYIQSLKEILYDLYGGDQNIGQKQKNIFLFCEESQFSKIQNSLQNKDGNNQILMNKLKVGDSLFSSIKKQYFINQELVPHEFHLLLDSFTIGKHRNQERFYAFLPKKVEQGVKLEKIQICIPTEDNSIQTIIKNNTRYTLTSYLDKADFEKQDIEDIKKAIQKAKDQKIESFYIYSDDNDCYQSELVRVNVKKRKIVYQRNKQQYVEYNEKDIQQDEKLNFVYIIRGYNQEDIKESQNQINSKLFINLKYFKELWDYNYVDEKIPKLLPLIKSDQNHIKTIDSFEKIFRKKQLKILEIQFIQNISLYQKFQEQVIQLHNKCKVVSEYQEPMFYSHSDNSILQNIFQCNSIGFDPRIHYNSMKNTNRILLENRPWYFNNINNINGYEQCLACFVVKGKVLKQDFSNEQFANLKRLPKDESDNQFYDCAQMEEGEEVRVAVFDFHRIYPAYLIKFQKKDESETNYTTDDQSRYHNQD